MNLTKEFNQIVLSIQVSESLTHILVENLEIEQVKVFKILTQINNLIQI